MQKSDGVGKFLQQSCDGIQQLFSVMFLDSAMNHETRNFNKVKWTYLSDIGMMIGKMWKYVMLLLNFLGVQKLTICLKNSKMELAKRYIKLVIYCR